MGNFLFKRTMWNEKIERKNFVIKRVNDIMQSYQIRREDDSIVDTSSTRFNDIVRKGEREWR